MTSTSASIAVVGAGVAGLTARYFLAAAGCPVETFDKGRGPGGRTSRRRAGQLEFDHGAQYFTTRTPEFARLVDSWLADGTVNRWDPRIGTLREGRWAAKPGGPERYVGVPGMNQPAKNLTALGDRAGAPPVRLQTRIVEAYRETSKRARSAWYLRDTGGTVHGPFRTLFVTAPPPQALDMLPAESTARNALKKSHVDPCWTVMAAFDPPLPLDWDAAFVESGILAWAARNSSKPGRPQNDAWVLHGTARWSRENLDAAPEVVSRALIGAFLGGSGLDADAHSPGWHVAHRWRFARPRRHGDKIEAVPHAPSWWNPDEQLGLAGDWLLEGRVEDAFRSGRSLADTLARAES